MKSVHLTPMTQENAQGILANYVCSTCYGHLVAHLSDEGTWVLCGACGEDTKGYVSKRYVERRQQESIAERMTAAHVLRNVIPSPQRGKSDSQLLKELGF